MTKIFLFQFKLVPSLNWTLKRTLSRPGSHKKCFPQDSVLSWGGRLIQP